MEQDDEKYYVFKREDFLQMLGSMGLPPWTDGVITVEGKHLDCAVLVSQMLEETEKTRVKDAVVIRRQDLFASPALAAYASCIAIVVRITTDLELKKRLLKVADYFHEQSLLAGEEGWHLPD